MTMHLLRQAAFLASTVVQPHVTGTLIAQSFFFVTFLVKMSTAPRYALLSVAPEPASTGNQLFLPARICSFTTMQISCLWSG